MSKDIGVSFFDTPVDEVSQRDGRSISGRYDTFEERWDIEFDVMRRFQSRTAL